MQIFFLDSIKINLELIIKQNQENKFLINQSRFIYFKETFICINLKQLFSNLIISIFNLHNNIKILKL